MRTIISTPFAPKAVGTYSQAVRSGNTVYVSGQIPLDPVSGNLVQGSMDAQIRRVFDNLKERVGLRIERAFSEIAVETMRREIHFRASQITGVPVDAGSAELQAGRDCARRGDRLSGCHARPRRL